MLLTNPGILVVCYKIYLVLLCFVCTLLLVYFVSYPYESLISMSASSCEETQFICANGQCIPEYEECNSNADCEDGSDEMNCCECIFFFLNLHRLLRKSSCMVSSVEPRLGNDSLMSVTNHFWP